MPFATKLPKIKTSLPEVDFGYLPELAPYLREPDAMYVGAPGKHGYLRMRFGFNCDGKCVLRELDRRVPIIVQQELYFDASLPSMPCVYILASGGPYIDGDRFDQDIELDPGAFAFVSTGAGTKISTMRSNYAGMRQRFTLHEDSYLEFLPEPVYPGQHSRFACDTEIVCHPSATITYSEIYMCGRKFYRSKLAGGEVYAYDVMSVLTRARRPDSRRDLFREKFVIEPYKRFPKTVGVMAGYDIFANVVVLTPHDGEYRRLMGRLPQRCMPPRSRSSTASGSWQPASPRCPTAPACSTRCSATSLGRSRRRCGNSPHGSANP